MRFIDLQTLFISVNSETMKTNLSDIEQRFILHWGQMGVQWGINRTVAQVHALLYLSKVPLNAEEICERLGVARSNVSTSLRELMGWGIVHKVPKLGEKCDYFHSTHDVWDLARTIAAERKKREIDPTLSLLRSCLLDARADADAEAHTLQRLEAMTTFLDTACSAFDSLQKLPTPALKALLRFAKPSKPN
jgi:DNA-binding transcriptional regulator GbsR (MarR family)